MIKKIVKRSGIENQQAGKMIETLVPGDERIKKIILFKM